MDESHKPHYWKEKKINCNRRASWHDYSSVCKYMITVRKAADTPGFSELTGTPANPGTRLTKAGNEISYALSDIHLREPKCTVYRRVIMPDHVHFILSVDEPLDGYTVSKIINGFMGNCTGRLRKHGLIAAEDSTFAKGFNDRILLREGQLDVWKNYIADNPRRLLVIKQHSRFFSRISRVEINGRICTVYGNFLLLRKPEKALGVISSRYTPDQRRRYNALWSECLRCGGVLVSPFISEKEKELYRKAADAGLSIIRIVKGGLPERFKPWKSEFELCSRGRLLLIADGDFNPQDKGISRNECLELNTFANYIVELPQAQMKLLGM